MPSLNFFDKFKKKKIPTNDLLLLQSKIRDSLRSLFITEEILRRIFMNIVRRVGVN